MPEYLADEALSRAYSLEYFYRHFDVKEISDVEDVLCGFVEN